MAAVSVKRSIVTTYRFFIKSSEKGQPVRPKYRKTQVAFLLAVLLFMSNFLATSPLSSL